MAVGSYGVLVVEWSVLVGLVGALTVVAIERWTGGTPELYRTTGKWLVGAVGVGDIAILLIGIISNIIVPRSPVGVTLAVLAVGVLPVAATGTGWILATAFVRDHGMTPRQVLAVAGRVAGTDYAIIAIAVVGFFGLVLPLIAGASGIVRVILPSVVLVGAGLGYAIVEPWVIRLKCSTTTASPSVIASVEDAVEAVHQSTYHVRMVETHGQSVPEVMITGLGPTTHLFVFEDLRGSSERLETAVVGAAATDRTEYLLSDSIREPLLFGSVPVVMIEPLGGILAAVAGIGASIVAYRAIYRRDAIASTVIGPATLVDHIETVNDELDRPLEWPWWRVCCRAQPDPASRIERLRSIDAD
ncbi:MAG: hypothetical protein ABEJ86_07755 [Halococcoides sp.]